MRAKMMVSSCRIRLARILSNDKKSDVLTQSSVGEADRETPFLEHVWEVLRVLADRLVRDGPHRFLLMELLVANAWQAVNKTSANSTTQNR